MSFYLMLMLGVIIAGTLSARWKSRLLSQRAAQSDSPEGQQDPADRQPLTRRVTRELGVLRSKFFADSQQSALAQRFGAWLNRVLPADDPLLVWLNLLPAEPIQAFTEQVAEFCNEMGFTLPTLVDGQLGHAPSAEQRATQIVLHYGYANYHAALAVTEFSASQRVLAYLRSPSSKANRDFGQKLYMKLVDKDVVPLPPFEILLTSEEKRDAQALEAIRGAAAQNPAAFNAALTEMLVESAASEPPQGVAQRLKRGAAWVAGPRAEKTMSTDDATVIKAH